MGDCPVHGPQKYINDTVVDVSYLGYIKYIMLYNILILLKYYNV